MRLILDNISLVLTNISQVDHVSPKTLQHSVTVMVHSPTVTSAASIRERDSRKNIK